MSKAVRLAPAIVTALYLSTAGLGAADQSLTGQISDSMCNDTHKTTAEHGKSMTDRDCVLACIKKGGKFVFVADGKVYNIENQSYADLKKHAGHTVKMTGDVNGDTVKVTKIEMQKASD